MKSLTVNKKKAEILRAIGACRDVLKAGTAEPAVLEETAEELKRLLVELDNIKDDLKNDSVNNGGKEMNKNLAMVAINKAIRHIPLTDEEKQALRNGSPSSPGQQGETPAKGGYLCPEEFVADVERLAQNDVRLKNYVHVYNTNYMKGSYPVRSEAATGLTKRNQLNTMTGKDINFAGVEFAIEDWYDFIPVANELIDDANADILGEVREAFAEDLVLQENKEILTAMAAAAGEGEEIADYNDIKKALDEDITVSARKNAVIVTNQTGWRYLDCLEDSLHRPLMVADIKDPSIKRFAGCEVVVLDKTVLANTTTEVDTKDYLTIPFYVGDLKKAVLFADRKGYVVDISKDAGFLQNATYLKINPRFDVVKKFDGVLKKLELVTDEEVED